MKVAIILFNINLKEFSLDSYFKIGCDGGALNATQNNINLDLSIGDFDSINKEEFELIKNNSKQIIKLNPIKDKTDVEEAIEYAKNISDDITIFGGIQGKRIEHFLSIINIFNKFENLKLIDNNSLIFKIKNQFEFRKDDYKDYKFVSFFSFNENYNISLNGFKYDLDNKNITKLDSSLLISNEMKENNLSVITNKDIFIIFSKLDNINNIA